MNIFWIGDNKADEDYLIDYASNLNGMIFRDADFIVATDDEGKLEGFAAIEANRDLADIVFFYVVDEARGKNVGMALLSEIEKTVLESGVDILRCVLPAENAMMALFDDYGYSFIPCGKEYAVSLGSLHYSETYRKVIEGKKPVKARTLEELTDEENKIFKHSLDENTLRELHFFNKKLSSVVINNGVVDAVLLCEANLNGVIVDYMHSDKEHPDKLLDCFKALDRALSAHKDATKDLKISFATGNQVEQRLIRALSGEMALIEEFVRENVAIKRLGAY